ncbi:MAG: nuclear transport factor 2 family protein [Pseudomonadota bacterium]
MGRHRISCFAVALLLVGTFSALDAAAMDPQELAEMYVESLSSNQVADLPLSDDVQFHGPLLEEPIEGRQQVLAFLNRVAPSLLRIEAAAIHVSDDGACIETVVQFAGMSDQELMEVACLRVTDGNITAIQLYFDPSPFLEQQPGEENE